MSTHISPQTNIDFLKIKVFSGSFVVVGYNERNLNVTRFSSVAADPDQNKKVTDKEDLEISPSLQTK